jgi:hypothetical protein
LGRRCGTALLLRLPSAPGDGTPLAHGRGPDPPGWSAARTHTPACHSSDSTPTGGCGRAASCAPPLSPSLALCAWLAPPVQKSLREMRKELQELMVSHMKSGAVEVSPEHSSAVEKLTAAIKQSEKELEELALSMCGKFSTPMASGRAMLF